jgi:hypothetical protein
VVHLITYELAGVRLPEEIGRIEATIKALGQCYSFHKTAWFVETELSNKEVCEKVAAALRPRDRIVVTRIHRDWVAANVSPAETEWLGGRNFHSANDQIGTAAPFPR